LNPKDFEAIASFTDTALRGRQLSSVEFVQDYLQIRFDGPCLTSTAWPRVVCDRNAVVFNDPGYRDSICALITNLVSKVYFANMHKTFVIEFDNEKALEIWLDDNAHLSPETIMFDNADRDWWVI
jgi:hypothetical protein